MRSLKITNKSDEDAMPKASAELMNWCEIGIGPKDKKELNPQKSESCPPLITSGHLLSSHWPQQNSLEKTLAILRSYSFNTYLFRAWFVGRTPRFPQYEIINLIPQQNVNLWANPEFVTISPQNVNLWQSPEQTIERADLSLSPFYFPIGDIREIHSDICIHTDANPVSDF